MAKGAALKRIFSSLIASAMLVTAVGCGPVNTGKQETSRPARVAKSAPEKKERSPEKPDYLTGTVTGLEPLTVMKVEAGPKSVELMPDGKRLFVNDLYARKNFIFDADTYAQLAAIPLPDEPVEADFSEGGRLAWVSLYNSAKVLVVDTAAGAVVGEVATGSIPKEIAVSPDGKWVYVANWNSNTVSVIDAAARVKVKDVPVPATPRGMCFSPGGDFAYVCIMGGSILQEVDVAAGHVPVRQIPCGSNPRHVLITKEGVLLYVSNNSPGTVTIVDRLAGKPTATIKVGSQARTIALTPDERYLFVCNYGENTVGCVDLLQRAQVFEVPASRPIGMTVSANGDRLFISNYAPAQISVMRIVRAISQ